MGGPGSGGNQQMRSWAVEQELQFLQHLGTHSEDSHVRWMSRTALFDGYLMGLSKRNDSTFTPYELGLLRKHALELRDHGALRSAGGVHRLQ